MRGESSKRESLLGVVTPFLPLRLPNNGEEEQIKSWNSAVLFSGGKGGVMCSYKRRNTPVQPWANFVYKADPTRLAEVMLNQF